MKTQRVDWLTDLRAVKGMTGADVARAAGISQQAYCFIETGQRRPSVRAAKRIAAVLGFDWTRFFEEPEQTEDSA